MSTAASFILVLSDLSTTPINLVAVMLPLLSRRATEVATAPSSPTRLFKDKALVAVPVTEPITLPVSVPEKLPENIFVTAV